MERQCILAIRIRGGVNATMRVEDTLKMLRLDRNMASTLLDDRPEYKGMLQHAKDYVTWGEPTVETVRLLLEIDALASALCSGDVEFHKLEGIKPFFRLHPPKKGFKRTVKRPYRARGELGYRGEAINELAKRMA
jgi:large subunit ribosomal protein L30